MTPDGGKYGYADLEEFPFGKMCSDMIVNFHIILKLLSQGSWLDGKFDVGLELLMKLALDTLVDVAGLSLTILEP